jgi:hypothetical protein
MKKFFSIGLLLLGVSVSQAQLTWFNTGAIVSGSTGATNTLVTAGNGIVRSLQFIGGNAALTVTLYDNGTATNKTTKGEYISVSQVASTALTTNVTYTGVTNIITNSIITMTYTTNSAAWTALPALLSVYVPASTLVTVESPDIKFQAGLVTSVSPNTALTTPITIIGSYAPLR